ncbi:MAG TPA: hypothetical protein VG820_10645, partial [Fimbriimonadaceae bacterium]|nr:hypothetical protein [Fimbriimonadaceae bacterium]
GLDFRGHQHDASPTGYATATGGYAASCTLKIVANVPGAQPFDVGPYTRTCFAIGGHLVPSIQKGDSWLAPERDPSSASYPPNYLQYFGYTFTGTKPSTYLQMPQTGMVASGPQPIGTSYEWSIVGNATFFPTSPASTDVAVQITATDQSGTGSIHVKCTYHFDNGDPNDPVTGQTDGLALELPDQYNTSTLKWQYGDHPGNPYWTLVQEFWGGTRNTQVSPEAAGVHIDNYTLKFWTDKILRTLTGF